MKIDGSDDEPKIGDPLNLVSLNTLLRKAPVSKTSNKAIEDKVDDIKEDFFENVGNRQKVHAWFDEYVVTEEFMKKVRRYARQEFDSMLLKVFIWITSIVLGTVIANLLLRR